MAEQATDDPQNSAAPEPHRHTVLKVILATCVVLAIVTASGVTWAYRHLNGNLTTAGFKDDVLQPAPEKVDVAGPQEQLNILVMGSDTREGAGNSIDGEPGAGASDTTLLIHLSADRERAYGMSIPRDTLVNRPSCKGESGAVLAAAQDVMWNAAFTEGGAACTIAQFQQLTKIPIDHFVIVDFNGFQGMVDAVGGVEVCIPADIDDRAHGIYLQEGERRISGREALSYVRVRHVGDGSDLGRIRRQQAFLASMSSEVLSAGTLTSPTKLYSFLDAATKALTLDDDLGSLKQLADLGAQFRGIGLDSIQFITVPWQYAPEDPNRVRLLQPQANQVFNRLRRDLPLTRAQTSGSISAGQVPGQSPAPSETASGQPTSSSGTSSSEPSPSGEPSRATPSESAQTESTVPTEQIDPTPDEAAQQANEQAGLC